jgi:hypothetical protein
MAEKSVRSEAVPGTVLTSTEAAPEPPARVTMRSSVRRPSLTEMPTMPSWNVPSVAAEGKGWTAGSMSLAALLVRRVTTLPFELAA